MHLGEFSYLSGWLKRSHSSGRTWVTSETRSCHTFLFSFKDFVCTGGTQRLRMWALGPNWPHSGQPVALGWPPDDSTRSLWSCSPSLSPAATTVFQLPGGTMGLPISGPLLMLPLPHRPWGWPSVLPVSFVTHRQSSLHVSMAYPRRRRDLDRKAEGLEPWLCFQRERMMYPDMFLDFLITPSLITDSLLWSLSLSPSKSKAHVPN